MHLPGAHTQADVFQIEFLPMLWRLQILQFILENQKTVNLQRRCQMKEQKTKTDVEDSNKEALQDGGVRNRP